MGKISKILICGHSGVGKTSILERLIYNNSDISNSNDFPTSEDTYVAMVETDRGVREKVRIYELGGTTTTLEKFYVTSADAVIFVYDVTNKLSFTTLDRLKREVDRNKERREVLMVICGNKIDLGAEKRVIDSAEVTKWAQKEKVKTFETSVSNRDSIMEAFVWTVSKITQPQTKTPFFGGRKEART